MNQKSTALVVLFFFISSAGCASHRANLACDDSCPQVNAFVTVGGRVHEPGKALISGAGLSLRQALLSAGGPRDVVVATRSLNVEPDWLKQLDEHYTQRGKIKARQRANGDLEPEVRDRLIEAGVLFDPDELKAARKREEERIEKLEERIELFRTQNDGATSLMDLVKDIAEAQEQLRLLENTDFRDAISNTETFPLDWNQEEIDENIAEFSMEENEIRKVLIETLTEGPSATSVQKAVNFVVLERQIANAPSTYYFPYELVAADIAGDIRLRDGDVINVLDASNIGFSSAISATAEVVVTGYVDKPGLRTKVPTIGSLVARVTPNGEIKPTIRDSRSVWLLRRPGLTGGERIYVLPDDLAATGIPGAARTQTGDVFSYTILPQVPIVLSSLLATNRQQVERERETALQKLKKKHRAKKDARHERVHNVLEKVCDRVIAPFRR